MIEKLDRQDEIYVQHFGRKDKITVERARTGFRPPRRGNRVSRHGDSLMADSAYYCQGSAIRGGIVTWLENKSVGGRSSAAMLANLESELLEYAKLPDYAMINISPNDHTFTAVESLANYVAIKDIVDDLNVGLIIVGSAAHDTEARRDSLRDVEALVLPWAREQGFPFIQIAGAVADPIDGSYAAGTSSDGTHPSQAGGHPLLAAWLGATDQWPYELEPRHALAMSNDDDGNLLTNGLFTTGSASAAPTGWSVAGSATYSKSDPTFATATGKWQNVTEASAAQSTLYQDVTTVVGERYEFSVRIKTDGNCGVFLRTHTNGDMFSATGAAVTGEITEAQGAVHSEEFIATATAARMFIGVGTAAAGTASFAQATVRHLPS